MFARFASLAVLLAVAPAYASDRDPVIVVPGRLGVPVMQNGRDISGSVVEGDWGLERPGAVAPQVFGPGWVSVPGGPVPNYFPATGRRPRLGRVEIEPPGPPRRAESFGRSWSANSDPLPPSLDPPVNPPAIIYAPSERGETRLPNRR